MRDGTFLNKQKMGLRVREFLRESRLNKRYQVVATFKTSSSTATDVAIVDEEEFIAILESVDFPLYFFTYDIDYA